MNYNNCNIATAKSSRNNYSKIPSSNNTHLASQQWDILSTTSDSITNSYNGRFINDIPSISTEDQLLQKDAHFKEYQRLHSENKKLEEKPDT